LPDQIQPIDQECPARLESTKKAHQLNRAPPAHPEEALEHGPVHHRRRQLL
jgi:hypothetical protein